MNSKPRISPSAANRRYQVHLIVAMLIYMALVFVSVTLLKTEHAPTVRTLLALMPALPIVWVMWAVIRYLGEADELQRRVHLEALSIAAGATAFLSLTYGLLEDLAGFPHFSAWWTFVVIDMIWGATSCILWRRYK